MIVSAARSRRPTAFSPAIEVRFADAGPRLRHDRERRRVPLHKGRPARLPLLTTSPTKPLLTSTARRHARQRPRRQNPVLLLAFSCRTGNHSAKQQASPTHASMSRWSARGPRERPRWRASTTQRFDPPFEECPGKVLWCGSVARHPCPPVVVNDDLRRHFESTVLVICTQRRCNKLPNSPRLH